MSTDPHARDNPGVVAPPPLIFGVGLLLGWGVKALLGDPGVPLPEELAGALALILALAGMALAAWALLGFKRAGTNPLPERPTTAIVTSGPYRFTRNPMYVSLALVYLALTLWLDSLWALLALIPVLATIRYGVIAREEAYLERKFGEGYLAYKRSVRRWL